MHEIALSKGTVRYRDVGRGPTILFVHGVFVDGTLWDETVARLSTSHRCVVPDWPAGSHRLAMKPGSDLSPAGLADLVIELMDALALEDVTLVGNDTGGAVCQLVAARSPARLGR